MQLTEFSDYSLRVLLYAGLKRERCTVDEIARNFKISKNHLVKVVHFLSQKAWLISYQGRGGGIEISPKALDISVGQVIRETEPNMNLLECFDPLTNTCPLIGVCQLERLLHKSRSAFFSELDKVKLKELVKPKREDPRLKRLRISRA